MICFFFFFFNLNCVVRVEFYEAKCGVNIGSDGFGELTGSLVVTGALTLKYYFLNIFFIAKKVVFLLLFDGS